MHGIEFQPFMNTKYHYPYLAKFLFIAGKKTLMKSFGLYASIKPRYDKTKNPVVSTGFWYVRIRFIPIQSWQAVFLIYRKRPD